MRLRRAKEPSPRAHVLCVLTDPPTRAELRRLRCRVGNQAVTLLAFSRAGRGAEQVLQSLGESVVTRLETARLMQQALPIVRERFVRFCAEWPERPVVAGKTFKELFVHEGLSLWWLCELSQKNTVARPTFWFLCELEVLRLALSEARYDEVVLLTRDHDLAGLFRQACRAFRVSAVNLLCFTPRWRDGFVWLCLGRIKDWCVSLAAFLLAALVLRLGGREPTDPQRSGTPRVVFLTWYPSQWVTWRGRLRDRYYVHLPDLLESSGKWKVLYACLVPSRSMGDIVRDWVGVVTGYRHRRGGPFEFLERFSSPWMICRTYLSLGALLTYLRLELFHRTFKASFAYDGVNIFAVARYDLRVSFLRQIPQQLLLAHRVKRFVQAVQPAWVVTILETHCSGRAVVIGVRASGTSAKVMGYQHSAVNANMLFYRYDPEELRHGASSSSNGLAAMPIPDRLILHGTQAQRMLEASGVPRSRLRVCGCPRFDDLMGYAEQRAANREALRQPLGLPINLHVVLVVGGGRRERARTLIRICAEATAGRMDLVLVFKPHPVHQHSEGDLADVVRGTRSPRWIHSREPINLLQAAADVMVTTHSTADVEAIAIGCPVIRVRLSDWGSSPSMDVPGATLGVESPGQLADALRRVFNGQLSAQRWPGLVEGVFYKLDGLASRRAVEAFEGAPALEATG